MVAGNRIVFRRAAQPRVDHGAPDIAYVASSRQQMAMLRMLGRNVFSSYGPTADTGGLAANGAQVIYPYEDEASLLEEGAQACFAGSGREGADGAAMSLTSPDPKKSLLLDHRRPA
ncbi:MAG: hypothetical protein WDO18_05405 [Acidobacteriota bacterium]